MQDQAEVKISFHTGQQISTDDEINRIICELRDPNARPKTLKELSMLLETTRNRVYERSLSEMFGR